MPKPKRTQKLKREIFILGMNQPDNSTFFLRFPTGYSSLKLASDKAKEKHATYSKSFSIYQLVGTTKVDPLDIQLELFK